MIGDTPNPLANEHARKALAYATDRAGHRRRHRRGRAVADVAVLADQPVGPARRPERLPGLRPRQGQGRGRAQYQQDTGASSLTFSLAGIADVDTSKIMQLVQSQWKEAGIDANIESLESTAFIGRGGEGRLQRRPVPALQLARPRPEPLLLVEGHDQGLRRREHQLHPVLEPDQMEADLATGRTSGYPDVRKKAYDDLVTQLNEAVGEHLALLDAVLDRGRQVASTACRRPTTRRSGNFQPKTWLADLWHQ